MALPTEPTNPIPTIATDATYDAPGDAWDGEPTKVAPSSGVQAQGYVPGQPRPADYDNWIFSTLSSWVTWLRACVLLLVEGPASVADNVLARFDGTTGKLLQSSGYRVTDAVEIEHVATKSRTLILYPADFSDPNSTSTAWGYDATGMLRLSLEDSGFTGASMADIPHGAVITEVKGLVTPGAARGAGDRVRIGIRERTLTFDGTESAGTAADVGFEEDDGAALVQSITMSGGLPYTVDKATKSAGFFVRSGNTGAANADRFYGVRVKFNDPGPSAR